MFSKRFACHSIILGCDRVFTGASDQSVLDQVLAHAAAVHGLDAPALPFITPTGVAMTRPVGRCEPPVERNRDNLRLL